MPELLKIILVFFLTVWVFLPLHILIHELGHALPALIFTREPVFIHLGTIDRPRNGLQFNLGRLRIVFPKSLRPWRGGGMVSFRCNLPKWKDALITAGGPLASFSLGAVTIYALIIWGKPHSFVSIYGTIFGLLGIVLFISNIYPNGSVFAPLQDGKVYYDGYRLAELISRNPALFNYGKAYNAALTENWDQVFESLNNAGDRLHAYSAAYTLRLVALLETRRLEEAEEFMAQKIRVQISGMTLIYLEILLHTAQKRYPEAEELLKTEAINAAEQNQIQNARMLLLFYRDKFDELLQLTETLLQNKKVGIQNCWYFSGVALQKLNRHEEALEMLRKAEREMPLQLHIHLKMAKSYLALNRIKEADKAMDRAARLNVGSPFYLHILGRRLRMEGRKQEALAAIRQAHSLRPDMEEIQEELLLAEKAVAN